MQWNRQLFLGRTLNPDTLNPYPLLDDRDRQPAAAPGRACS